MSVITMITFQGCHVGTENVVGPDGELAGRALVITDQENAIIYRLPMDMDGARSLGQKLMGIGDLQVPNGAVVSPEVRDHINRISRKGK